MSVNDSPAYGSLLNYPEIFSLTANLGEGFEKNLRDLLLKLNPETSGHPYANIPQLILPGGRSIQSLTPDKDIQVIGEVFAKKTELEGRELKFERKNILLYPYKISLPISAFPVMISKEEFDFKNLQWRYLPSFLELFEQAEIRDFVTKNPAFFKKLPSHGGASAYKIATTDFLPMFPNIISMIPGEAAHYFTNITVNDPTHSYVGVMKFIRDAFHDLNGRPVQKTFLIEKLTGPNDVLSFLEAARAEQKIIVAHELEGVLKNKDIINLEQVIIRVKGELKYDDVTKSWNFVVDTTIAFQAYGSAWELILKDKIAPDEMKWNFKKVDQKAHQEGFAKEADEEVIIEPSRHKTLPEILQAQKIRIAHLGELEKPVFHKPVAIELAQLKELHKKVWDFLPSLSSDFMEKIDADKKLALYKYENSLDNEFPAFGGIVNQSLPINILSRAILAEGFDKLKGEIREVGKIAKSIRSDVEESYSESLSFPFNSNLNKDIDALKLPYEVTFEKLTNFNHDQIKKFENQLQQFKLDAEKKFPSHKDDIAKKIPNTINAEAVHKKAYQWLISKALISFKNKPVQPVLKTIKEMAGLSHRELESNDNAYSMIGLIDHAKELFINSRLQQLSEIWLVDEIITNDDLLLLLEITRLMKKVDKKPQELEMLLRKLQMKPITFKNVILTVISDLIVDKKNKPNYRVYLSLKFTFDDAAWHFHTTIDRGGLADKPWQFEKSDKASHDDEFFA